MVELWPHRPASRRFKMGRIYLALGRVVKKWFWVQVSSMSPLKLVVAVPILVVAALLTAVIVLMFMLLFFILWLAWMIFHPLRRSPRYELPEDGWRYRE